MGINSIGEAMTMALMFILRPSPSPPESEDDVSSSFPFGRIPWRGGATMNSGWPGGTIDGPPYGIIGGGPGGIIPGGGYSGGGYIIGTIIGSAGGSPFRVDIFVPAHHRVHAERPPLSNTPTSKTKYLPFASMNQAYAIQFPLYLKIQNSLVSEALNTMELYSLLLI